MVAVCCTFALHVCSLLRLMPVVCGCRCIACGVWWVDVFAVDVLVVICGLCFWGGWFYCSLWVGLL